MKNKWLDIMVNSFISGLIILFGFYLTSSDMDAREMSKKIEEKADKAYVDKEITEAIHEHEKVDAARYKGITDMFNIIREEQGEMRKDIKELLKK